MLTTSRNAAPVGGFFLRAVCKTNGKQPLYSHPPPAAGFALRGRGWAMLLMNRNSGFSIDCCPHPNPYPRGTSIARVAREGARSSNCQQPLTSPTSHTFSIYTFCVRDAAALQSSSTTLPAPPSMRTRWPFCRRWQASRMPITAGMPSSRAVTAPCDSGPPLSVMTPLAW